MAKLVQHQHYVPTTRVLDALDALDQSAIRDLLMSEVGVIDNKWRKIKEAQEQEQGRKATIIRHALTGTESPRL